MPSAKFVTTIRSSRGFLSSTKVPYFPSLSCTSPSRNLTLPSNQSSSFSTFSYLVAGRVKPRQHEVIFDEDQRKEKWTSDQIPVLPLMMNSNASSSHTPNMNNTVQLEQQILAKLPELQNMYPETYLVHIYKDLLILQHGGPTIFFDTTTSSSSSSSSSSSVSNPSLQQTIMDSLLAGPTTAEKELMNTVQGREELFTLANQYINELHHHCTLSEANASTVHSLAHSTVLPVTLKNTITKYLRRNVALATLKAIRMVNIAQVAYFRTLTVTDAQALEYEWLQSLGFTSLSSALSTTTLSSSVRNNHSMNTGIPKELSEIITNPLSTPLTNEERRNDNHGIDYANTKRLAMEHRDRTEIIPRRNLPLSIATDAPNKQLEIIAKTLEENKSLSLEDREYMLAIYARAFNQTDKDMFDEKKLLDDKETAAWYSSQPQWGVYDPELVKMQDDVQDAYSGRGKFSVYRGLTYRNEQIHPESYGENSLTGSSKNSNQPLETIEEAALAASVAESQLAAESLSTTIAVAASLERAMGLKPRPVTTVNKGITGNSFFKRLAANQISTSPAALATGHRVNRPRVEAVAESGKGGKDAGKGGKGGKAAPAAAGKAPAKAKK